MTTYSFSAMAAAAVGTVPWRDDLLLPASWEVTVDDDDSPYVVKLKIIVEDGDPVVESLAVDRRPGGPPVSTRALRQVRIGDYLNGAAHLAALRPAQGGGLEPAYSLGATFDVQTDTAAHLEAVAAVYNAAVSSGSRTPRKAVQSDPRWRPVPEQTAARWIRRAKDAGLIRDKASKRAARPRRGQQ